MNVSDRRPRIILLVVVVLILCIGGSGLYIWQVQRDARQKIAAIRETLQEPAPLPPEQVVSVDGTPSVSTLSPSLAPFAQQACTNASDLARTLGPLAAFADSAAPATALVKSTSELGARAAAMIAVGSAAGETVAGLNLACEALEPLLAVISGPGDRVVSSPEIVGRLAGARAGLRDARERLRSASAKLAVLDYSQLDDSTRGTAIEVRDQLPTAIRRISLLIEIPGMLGADGPRRYLVLGQNNDEIRPTGGFIGSAGVLVFDGGQLVEHTYWSSFMYKTPPDLLVQPPAPLQRNMQAAYWHLFEANWAPDFPSTAEQARYFFGLSQQGQDVDGVIAIDQELLSMLFTVSGPIDVPSFGETVTAENVRQRIEYYVHELGYREPGAPERRKDFLSAVFAGLFDRLRQLEPGQVPRLITTLHHGLTTQHAQVWLKFPDAQAAVSGAGWDGRLLAAPSDYLYVVNANLGANKVNRDVRQSVRYQIAPRADGRIEAQVTVELTNATTRTDPGPYPTLDYRDYLRVLVPKGSRLLASDGVDSQVDTIEECQRSSFGSMVVTPPGQTRTVVFRYELPTTVSVGTYSLVVQKQPGVPDFPIKLGGTSALDAVGQISLDGSQFFDGHGAGPRRADRLLGLQDGQASQPVCDIFRDPPEVLHPPVALTIPKIDVEANVVGLGVEDSGRLEAPATGNVTGWYVQSGRPGQVGNSIMSGHVDWDKRPAVFWRLSELREGDLVEVRTEEQQWTYRIEWIRRFDAKTDAVGTILGPTYDRLLTLITCDGPFDAITGDYAERLVVRARLVP